MKAIESVRVSFSKERENSSSGYLENLGRNDKNGLGEKILTLARNSIICIVKLTLFCAHFCSKLHVVSHRVVQHFLRYNTETEQDQYEPTYQISYNGTLWQFLILCCKYSFR